jgi:hypothetical protein
MPELWLTAIPNDEMHALLGIRDALRFFRSEANLRDADEFLEVFKKRGFVLIGSAPSELLDAPSSALARWGCESELDVDPERYFTEEEVFAAEAPATQSTTASDTALVLMAASEGNPIRAAITAANLARTTGDAQTHHAAITALVSAFPWLAKALVTHGVEL